MLKSTSNVHLLDEEWIGLMEEAKKLGLTVEEVKQFLTETPAKDAL